MARSQTNTARIDGLRPGMVYVVQVRARTVAGYGKFSGKMCFQTLTDGKGRASDLGIERPVQGEEEAPPQGSCTGGQEATLYRIPVEFPWQGLPPRTAVQGDICLKSSRFCPTSDEFAFEGSLYIT